MTMARNVLALVLGLYVVGTLTHASSIDTERKPYIVYMGEKPQDQISALGDHYNVLLTATGKESIARTSKIHSYRRSFNGFVARLLPHEVEKLSRDERVISVFRNRINQLHTTRSWDFLGMSQQVKRKVEVESDIIVGVLDTGIFSAAPSFNDKGFGPVPAKWKGKCEKGANFTGCNNKVIGAQYYMLEKDPTMIPSPVDDDGHGTHTSSTLAGSIVDDASLYGVAGGTARGGVPSARIAMYKVCWTGCSDMDLLAAFDDAIADGVDVLSVSIGGASRNFFEDPIAIGSFHAMKNGILTSCSAGNQGPYPGTVENVAPWVMTVAASTIDRQFVTAVKLGDGTKIKGISINTFSPKKTMYPLTSGALAASGKGDNYGNVSACDYGLLSLEKVEGRVVYCEGSSGQDYTIGELKGAGVIMTTGENMDAAFTTLVPGTNIPSKYGYHIDHYINTTKNPQAVVYKTTTANMSAPSVASFSSRGPQFVNLNILKPDISAPGVNILAAYTELASITGDPGDNRIIPFNILSGTSMACPHTAAAAAYVKSFHPNWSPAAIKSALMTTAKSMKNKGADKQFGYGSGQINPRKAVHPGLIYDITLDSYISFLCSEGYNGTTLRLLIGGTKKYNCSDFKPARGTDGLNYPSMHKHLVKPSSKISAVFYRTVTQVGYGKSTYEAKVFAPKGLTITVDPSVLEFDKAYQRKSFKVIVTGPPMANGTQMLSGAIKWRDSNHTVTSPILIYQQLPMS